MAPSYSSHGKAVFLPLAVAVLCFCLGYETLAAPAASNPPLIIIPGLTGSDLTYKLHGFQSHYPWCKNSTSTWNVLWPLQKYTIKPPEQIYCWLEALMVSFDPVEKKFSSWPGENVSTVDFGGFLGTSFARLSQSYTANGWVVGETLFCAPYDWRLPGSSMIVFHQQLQQLVESVHASTGQKVNLLAISFGPQVTLSFLHSMTPAWRDKHIAWFIAESPVWSGAPIAVESMVSGFGSDQSSSSFLRQISLRVASTFWLFPRAGTSNSTWGADEVIVGTPARGYTANDIIALLHDLGLDFLTEAVETLQADADLANFSAPLVDTLVTYGYGLGTPGYFYYDQPFVSNASVTPLMPAVVTNMTETGDTLVPLRSSLRGQWAWPEEQAAAGKQLLHRGYPGQVHGSCCVASGGICFNHVMALLINGTIPPEVPERAASPSAAEMDRELAGVLGGGLLFPL